MPVTTYQEVADALKACLQSITIANGYSVTLPSDHFYDNFDAEKLNKTEQKTYPKVFICEGEIVPVQQPSRRKKITQQVFVTLVVLQSKTLDVAPQTQLRPMADDLEKMLANNETLNGKVTTATLTGLSFDAGFAHPEGICIAELSIEYFKQY